MSHYTIQLTKPEAAAMLVALDAALASGRLEARDETKSARRKIQAEHSRVLNRRAWMPR